LADKPYKSHDIRLNTLSVLYD